MKKARWIIFAAVTLGLFVYLYFSEGSDYPSSDILGRIGYVFDKLYSVFRNLDVKYLLLAILIQLLANSNDAFTMHHIRRKYQKVPYFYTLHSTFFGISIGALLPGFLSAGAVSEISLMNLQGLDVHKAGSMVLTRQIGFFISICFLPLAFILMNIGYFQCHSTLILNILYGIGFFVNLLTIFFYAFIAKANKLLFRCARIIILFFAKIGIIKNSEKLLEKTKNTLDSLKEQMSNLPLKWYDWVFVVGAMCINVIFGNLVSFCSALALGIHINGTFSQMIASSGFVSAIQSTLPVPSGIGIADVAYKNIMQPLVGSDNINYLLLLWRIITFYIPIIISVIVMLFPIPGRKHSFDNSKS